MTRWVFGIRYMIMTWIIENAIYLLINFVVLCSTGGFGDDFCLLYMRVLISNNSLTFVHLTVQAIGFVDGYLKNDVKITNEK